jgi:Fe-S-cluster containining protein
VRVTEDEAAALAAHLGLDLADFSERHTRLLDDGTTSLTEKPNHECIFWSRTEGCTVYAARPRQCRTWPFWARNLASEAHWRAAARGCPGMDHGPLFELTRIARRAADDGTSGEIPRADEL